GLVLADLGRDREAVTALSEATRLQPDDASAHYNLALALTRLDRCDEALDHFARAAPQEGREFLALLHLGAQLFNHHTLTAAPPVLERAVRLNPVSAEGQYYLGSAQARQGHYDEAVRCYREVLGLRPEEAASVSSTLGSVLLRQGKATEALGFCRRAVALK